MCWDCVCHYPDPVSGVMTVPLLTTKLFIPRPRPGLVARPRLLARLDEALSADCKLILISAPAGSGKTMLLAAWAHDLGTCPVTWLSLDEEDSDPVRFWTYMVAALRALPEPDGPVLGEAALAALSSPMMSAAAWATGQVEGWLAPLINEVAALPYDFVLVLDDYHLLASQAVHVSLAYLLDHLPPAMHLVIAGRADPPLPLARLRARGQLTELRADDLRFTSEEAVVFFEQTMGLPLSREDVRALEDQTEGWVAGLQMAALSLGGYGDASNLHSRLVAFAGSDRFVLDYFTEEVLAGLPEHERSFLLRTAVLDRLCAELCGSVCEGRNAQALLEQFERRNLFIIPLDHARRWYRYHRLFAEQLRQRLASEAPAEEVAALNRRASAWCVEHGLPDEAIGYSLAARDWARATALVEEHAYAFIIHGEVATVLRWVESFPSAWLSGHAGLCLVQATATLAAARFAEGEACLEAVEAALRSNPASGARWPRIAGYIAAYRATAAQNLGDLRRTLDEGQRALTLLAPDDWMPRSIVTLSLADVYMATEDLERAATTYAEALAAAEASDNRYISLNAMSKAAQINAIRGRLRAAETGYRRTLALIEGYGQGVPPVAGIPADGLARVLYEWSRLDEAADYNAISLEQFQHWGHVHHIADGLRWRARIKQAMGDAAGAQADFERGWRLIQESGNPPKRLQWAAFYTEFALTQGDLASALRIYRENGLPGDDWLGEGTVPAGWQEEVHYHARHLAQARLLLAQGDVARARVLLASLLARAQSRGAVGDSIVLLILQAWACQIAGESGRALVALESALALGEPEGYVRTFVDQGTAVARLLVAFRECTSESRLAAYAARLLPAFEPGPPSPQPPPCEGGGANVPPSPGREGGTATSSSPHRRRGQGGEVFTDALSERELDVVRLIAAGLSNQEIADALIISLNTVKTHIKRIYGKLHVGNRLALVEVARQRRLL
jgi:LuxR family maltose regulon positive regulatory protein